jgi:hypothetical protein
VLWGEEVPTDDILHILQISFWHHSLTKSVSILVCLKGTLTWKVIPNSLPSCQANFHHWNPSTPENLGLGVVAWLGEVWQ